MPSRSPPAVKALPEIGGGHNWRCYTRILKPPGGDSHDVVGPSQTLWPSRKGFVNPSELMVKKNLTRQRHRDRGSRQALNCLAPDHPFLNEKLDSSDTSICRTHSTVSGRARCEMDSTRIKLILGSIKDFDESKREWRPPLYQYGTQKRTTRRRCINPNDSNNINKLLFRWNPEEDDKAQAALRQLMPARVKKMPPINAQRGGILGTGLSPSEEVVWQPSRRLAYQFLMTKGFHARKWEDDSLQRLLNKQMRTMNYVNHHWKSSILNNDRTYDTSSQKPYVYNNVLESESPPIRSGPKCRSSEDVRNPITGEQYTFHRSRHNTQIMKAKTIADYHVNDNKTSFFH